MPPVIDNLADLVEIGRGGFGVVYQARQVDLGRLVAVKVLPDVRGDSDAFGRFARECQALAALGGHPNIATVFGCGLTDDGAGYLSLELLPGGSLAEKVSGGTSSWQSVASWGIALSGALETAHRAGITHRDIKPENVLFDGLGTPKLVDFGIAGVPGAFRTTTGAVTLTLAHAAPEVVAGGRGGVPGDIYALASTLFAALAGGAAFVAAADETLVPMLARIASAPVPDLRQQGVPDAVCATIERAMAKDPADRPASAEAFGMSLQAALAEEGVAALAPPLLLLSGAAAALITGGLSDPSAGVGAASSTYSGERTLTGWATPAAVLAVAAPAVVEPATPVVPLAERRRFNGWMLVAAAAVAVLGMVAWRGLDAPTQAASGPTTARSTPGSSSSSSSAPSASATPSSGAHAAPSTPTRSTTPLVSRTSQAPVQGATVPSASRSSSKPTTPAPSSSSPTPSPSSPPPVVPPGVPVTVRVSGAGLVAGPAGSPAQVSLSVHWAPPTSGTAPTSYEVRWMVVGGPKNRAITDVPWSTALSGTVTLPVPAAGAWIRWEVRSVSGSTTSRWVVARAVLPKVVGRRTGPARAALRALGILTSTYPQVTTVPAQVGHVVAQSLPPGRVVAPGTSIALGVGTKP